MKNRGQTIIFVLLYIFIAVFIFTGSLVWIYSFVNLSLREIDKIKSLNIAESGIEYVRWYLNHFPTDYNLGNNSSPPYVYPFYDRLGNKIGEFSLFLEKPVTGTTMVQIKSIGKLDGSNVEKEIKAILAKPSLAKYVVLIDDNVRFGLGTVVYGEIHSNKGIRFDGIAYNLVKSSLITYSDPDHSGCKEWAVHTHVEPQDPCPPPNPDPSTIPLRQDIFKAGREVGAPSIDFIGLSINLSEYKNLAQNGGLYFGFSGDNNYGYEIVLNENNFEIYKVTSIVNQPNFCIIFDTYEGDGNNSRYKHSTWSIKNKQFLGTYNYPSNGIIFVEDNVWVSGIINGRKIIIASARFPENPANMTNIIINKDLLYTNYNGNDAIALIAQRNINVGLKSEDDLRIDAVLIAQNGRVGRYYYSQQCGPEYKRTKITVYGSIISRFRYGFSWVSGNTWSSGYRDRELIYNRDFLYFPPPFFPLSSEFYQILKWKEK